MERTKGLFSNLEHVTWSDALQAFVNTLERVAVDGDSVTEEFAGCVSRGEITATDDGVYEFSARFNWDADSYDDQFRVERDPDTREWVRSEENPGLKISDYGDFPDDEPVEEPVAYAAKLSNLAAIDAQMRAER